MIITRVIGGLGNQMFQYAAGLSLSIRNNTNHVLDINDFGDTYTLRKYELDAFDFNPVLAPINPTKLLRRYYSRPFWYLPIKHRSTAMRWLTGYTYFRETQANVMTSFFKLPSNCYLDGHWNSEIYFKDHQQLVRNAYTFSSIKDSSIKRYAALIGKCNSVSIHVRRTDYETVSKNLNLFGLCGTDYYESAMSYINSRIKNVVYFVFADDKQWAKNNIKPQKKCFYIEHSADNFEDMRLMSLCNHNIIANSTFSWWGAWLNPNKDKIVVAPKSWWKADHMNDQDVVPKHWKKI